MSTKRILSLVLALVMVLGTFGTMVFAAPSDVEGTVYETAVERLELLGILEGYPDGTFKPENQITRAEFAAVVVRAKGLEAVANAAKGLPTGFSDVAATSWAAGYVGTAAKLGIVNGVGNGLFAPNAPVKYEEAITMLVRALGYEEAAKARGAYPYGYLIVANENGLLNAVKGTQGLPALRGTVAQLADNALEIPMMIQVGFGAQTKWVVSGTEDTKVRHLLDDMGFNVVEGRVSVTNASKNRIKVGKEDVTVDEGFDFNFVEGLEIKAWTSAGKVVVYSVQDEAIYAPTVKGDKVTVGSTKYAVAKDAKLVLDNETVEAEDFTSDYAKVVLNDEDEIVWAKGYKLNDFLVVAEVDGNVAHDYDKVDVNLKDYTLLKDGKTISVKDLEELDILLFNRTEKFAIVYNDSKVGEIGRVYSNEFRFEGDVYEITGEQKYLDDKAFGALTSGVLAAMLAEEKDVEIFFDTHGDVLLVVGSRGVAPSSSYYGLVTYVHEYSGRRGNMLALDVRNKEGKVVSYDIAEKDGEYATLASNVAKGLKDKVVLVTVNKDDALTKLATVDSQPEASKFKISASYVGGKRLQDSTIIFYSNKAVELGEAKGFTEIEANSTIYYNTSDRVVAIVGTTNAGSDNEPKTDLVTAVRRLTNETYEFTFANGDRYVTASKDVDATDYVNEVVTLLVNKTSGLVVKNADGKNGKVLPFTLATIDKRNTGTRIIETDVRDFELVSGAKLYDITNPNRPRAINLSDLAKDQKIQVYLEGSSTRFAGFIVRVPASSTPGNDDVKGVVTYKTATAFEIDNKTIYNITADSVLKDGTTTTAIGLEVGTKLSQGDQVKVEGNVITRIAKAADRAAAKSVDDAIALLKIADKTAPTQAERLAITNARTAYGNLTATQKALVTKLADLVALEAIVEKADEPTPLDAINGASNEIQLYNALVNAEIDNVLSNLKAEYFVAISNETNLDAVQGAVDKVNATYAMNTGSSWDSTGLVLTVRVNSDLAPAALEVDHSQEGTLPEFWVYADSANPYGDAEDKAAFEEAGVTVDYADGTWRIDFSGLVDADGNDATTLLSGINFYLKVVDADGNEFGSMYNGGYLTIN